MSRLRDAIEAHARRLLRVLFVRLCQVPARSMRRYLHQADEMKEDKKLAVTSGGAAGISALASFIGLCCIGPWAVAVLGVPGAVTMARWEPVRPYLLGVAVLMLLWAFWRVYGPPRRRLCAADLCPRRPSIWLQAGLWVAATLVGLAFFADQLQWLLVDPAPEGLRR